MRKRVSMRTGKEQERRAVAQQRDILLRMRKLPESRGCLHSRPRAS